MISSAEAKRFLEEDDDDLAELSSTATPSDVATNGGVATSNGDNDAHALDLDVDDKPFSEEFILSIVDEKIHGAYEQERIEARRLHVVAVSSNVRVCVTPARVAATTVARSAARRRRRDDAVSRRIRARQPLARQR